MLKGAMLVGKPVLSYHTNQTLALVEGILIDHETNRLAAFWVVSGGTAAELRVLSWSGVKMVEAARVVAWSVNMLAIPQELFSVRRLMNQKTIRPGMRFTTTTLQNLGTMLDYYFDEKTGTLEGYEVAGGVWAEDASERGFLPAPRGVSITDEVVWVPANTLDTMQEKPGGLPAVLEKVRSQGRSIAPDELISLLLPHLEGLRVQRDVWLKNGAMLAARGQITSASLFQRAQEQHAERQLLKAIGLDLDAFSGASRP